MKRIVVKVFIFCVVFCGITAIMLWCDVVRERRFISQVMKLHGERVSEVIRRLPAESKQTDNILVIHRKRVGACLWRALGCDTSMAVYLVVLDGKILRQGSFATWFPSMTMVEIQDGGVRVIRGMDHGE